MNLEIKSILPWSEPKKVVTRAGDRLLSTAEPTQEFWQLWRDNKEALKASGISLGKRGEAWQACWWQATDPVEAAAKLAAVRAKQEAERIELERALAGIDAALPPELEARMLAIAPKCLAYQVPSVRRQVKALLDYNKALDASDTGTGKTYVNLATCAVLGRPVFVVCPKAVRPSWRRAAEHFGVKLVGVENHEILRGGRTTWVKIVKEGKAEKFVWSLSTDTVFIFDEIHRCFTGDTLVETEHGPMPISELVENKWTCSLESVNLSTDEREQKRITGHFKFPAERLVKVVHEHGEITCTSDHKFWCDDVGGWVEAAALEGHVLRTLRPDANQLREVEVLQPEMLLGSVSKSASDYHAAASNLPGMSENFYSKMEIPESHLVQRKMLCAGKVQKSEVETAASRTVQPARASEASFRTNAAADAGPEIEVASGLHQEDENQQSGNPTWSEHSSFDANERPNLVWSGREWSNHETAEGAGRCYRIPGGVSNRRSWLDEELFQMPAVLLQGRLGDPGTENFNRGGRKFSQTEKAAVFRRSENQDACGSRVVRVEVLEQGNRRGLAGSDSKDQFVYCLEVADNHNFFANGVLVSNCKDFRTLNCKMALASISQGYTVLGLSATSADNPMHMKFSGLLAGLFADERDFFKWMMRNGVTRGRFGMEFNGGRECLAKIHKQIFPLHGIRIRIADLGDQFPETQISAESYDLNGVSGDIQRAYDEMASEIARIEASSAEDKGACILTEILRARQRAEVLKVPAIADMATDQMDEGMSVAIFCNFDDTIDALCAKLGTKCVIRGGQSDADRQANIDAFNADREHVIICNIKAGGVGVSLHGTKTSRMRFAIICPCHSGQDLKQALGRVWRANGARSIQRIFFAAGTIEESVCKGVNSKISRIDILNDGIPDDDLAIGAERNFKLEAEERLALRSLETPEPAAGSTATTVTVSQASAKVVAKRQEIDALAAKLTPAQCRLAHQAMQRLDACNADGAREVNGVGFSKTDSEFGRKLAQAASLSPRQGAYAVRLAVKYRKQLGDLFPEFYAKD